MTLTQTIQKIDSLQNLVGQKAPKWNSPILEMIPAPVNSRFTSYIKSYENTGSFKKGILKSTSEQFDILLIFCKSEESLVYEWYSYFY